MAQQHPSPPPIRALLFFSLWKAGPRGIVWDFFWILMLSSCSQCVPTNSSPKCHYFSQCMKFPLPLFVGILCKVGTIKWLCYGISFCGNSIIEPPKTFIIFNNKGCKWSTSMCQCFFSFHFSFFVCLFVCTFVDAMNFR